ncbi:MAG: tetratricopeptide repeat protein [Acidobacteriota bacterium]|nr:tetratricopeptide repeat protein [Acidobacteriota bacterium]
MSEEIGGEAAAFDSLKVRGQQAVEAGRLLEAEALFEEVLGMARLRGHSRQIDLAVCNRAAAAIELGRGEGELPRLREILLRNGDPVSCRIAAYNIARHYELVKNYKKALFYARIARDRSEFLGRRDWLASSHNLIGNTLLAESFVEEAAAQYEQALALMPEEPSAARAGILDNLGYCRLLQGRFAEGYPLLYRGLKLAYRFGASRFESLIRVDLCYAHLETEHYRLAYRQGTIALELAERIEAVDLIKNALYLLGEVANLSGDAAAARGYFDRLQQQFFPEVAYLSQFLLAVDVRKLVNLHA